MVSNPAGEGEELHGTLVTHSTRAKPGSESLAVEGRCSMSSRARLGPIPTQAERKVDAPPPQTHIPLRQCCYLSFKGYSKQIKGKKNADIVCLREAKCKQLCYTLPFTWIDTEDPSAGAQQRPWVHMAVPRQNQTNPRLFSGWKLAAGGR